MIEMMDGVIRELRGPTAAPDQRLDARAARAHQRKFGSYEESVRRYQQENDDQPPGYGCGA